MNAADRLYALLPAIMRLRDGERAAAERGRIDYPTRADGGPEGPLHSLFQLLAIEVAALEAEVGTLEDSPFIETCPDWAVPYIGDLLRARIVDTGAVGSARRQVAETIANRRGKGTARTLARRANNLADGRPAEAVEYLHHVITAAHLDFPGQRRPATVALLGAAGRAHTLPDTIGQHTVELRDMREGGRFAVPNVGIRVWPMRALPHAEVVPTPVAGGDPGRLRLSPTGADIVLWRRPDRDAAEVTRLHRREMPAPIPLRDAVDNPADYYGPDRSIALWIGGTLVDPGEIHFCDLSDAAADGSRWNARGTAADLARIRIDPARGRLALPPARQGLAPDAFRVLHHIGAVLPFGGAGSGPTPLALRPRADGSGPAIVREGVTRAEAEADLAAALAAPAAVRIDYGGTLAPPVALALPDAATVDIGAGGGVWPTLDLAAAWRLTGGRGSTLILSGLRLIGGALEIDTTDLASLVLSDLTLVPGLRLRPDGSPDAPTEPSLVIRQEGLEVVLERCVTGPIHVAPGVRLRLVDTIVDAPDPATAAITGLVGPRGILSAERTTVVGDVAVRAMEEVSDTLFASRPGRTGAEPPVRATHVQEGCVRYSAFPPGAVVPRPFRSHLPAAGAPGPIFASLAYGTADYARLLPASPAAILSGGENRREMGAMNRASWGRLAAALGADAPDWTPFALGAGVELMAG